MAQPPRFAGFTLEQYPEAPEWFGRFLTNLSESMTDVTNGMTKGLTRADNLQGGERVAFVFTTKTPASGTFPLYVKNDLPAAPKHVQVGQLYRKDGKAMANAFSMTWVMGPSNQIALTFNGLEDATQYVLSLNYE